MSNPKRELRTYLSPQQVAEKLGVHVRTIKRAVHARQIEAYNPFPRKIRIPLDAVEKFLEQRSIGRPAA